MAKTKELVRIRFLDGEREEKRRKNGGGIGFMGENFKRWNLL